MKILLNNKFDVTRIVQRIIDSNITSSSGRTLETRGKSLSKTTFEHRRTGTNIFGEAVLVLPEFFCFCPKKKQIVNSFFKHSSIFDAVFGNNKLQMIKNLSKESGKHKILLIFARKNS